MLVMLGFLAHYQSQFAHTTQEKGALKYGLETHTSVFGGRCIFVSCI